MMRLDASISAASNTCVAQSTEAFKAGKGQTELVKSQAVFKEENYCISPAHLTRMSSWSFTVDSSGGSQAETLLRGWGVFTELLLQQDFNSQLSAIGHRAVLEVRVLG